MNMYITNLINDKKNGIVSHYAKDLGFKEVCLLKDKNLGVALIKEQLKNIDSDDLVVLQLPLEYGVELFSLLTEKHVKIACLIHEYENDDSEFYKMADCLMIDKKYNNYIKKDKVVLIENDSEFYMKMALLECAESFVNEGSTTDQIHIAFGLHDKTGDYSVWVAVTMQSIIDHTNSTVCFHIVHDETLNEDNKNKFIRIAENGNCLIEFHLIDIKVFDQIATQVKGYTIGSVFRILIPEILKDLNKILYLDADLFVNVDVADLWNVDIDEYCIGAVRDMNVVNHRVVPLPVRLGEMRYDEYFNSGVLLMNLKEIRKNGNMKQQIVNYLLEHNESDLPDQDALNVVYREKTTFLNANYNFFVRNLRENDELRLEKKIYHFVGETCILYLPYEIYYIYIETVLKVRWGIKPIDTILKNSLIRINDRIVQYENVVHEISNKNPKKIICADSSVVNNFYSVFKKENSDFVSNDIHEIESVLTKCKEERIGFVLCVSAGINGIFKMLDRFEYVNGIDYFVIQRFLSVNKGGYIV